MLISQAGLELLEHAKSAVKNGLNVETRLLQAQAEYGLTGITEAITANSNHGYTQTAQPP